MNEYALEQWALFESDREHLEEALFDKLIGELASVSVQQRIKPVRSVVLDVCSGYAVPMLTESLTDYSYHGLEDDSELVRLTRSLMVDNATIEARPLAEVLASQIKEPVAMILSAPPEKPVPRGGFIGLVAYRQGETSSRVLLGEWIAQQVSRNKAVVGALVLPKEQVFKPSIPWDRQIEGDRQRAYLWHCTRTIALSTKPKAELLSNGWAWSKAENMIDGQGRLLRRKTHLVPRFKDRQDLLKAITHIRQATNDHHQHAWDERGAYQLDTLSILNLMKYEDLSVVPAASRQAIGIELPLDVSARTHLKRKQTHYRYLHTPYPDNGDQTCRYWLLKQGDLVKGKDGTYRVVSYQPAPQQGQPPTITLEKVV